MEQRARGGETNAGTCRRRTCMLHCARLAHARSACCAVCRYELSPPAAPTAFTMPPTVSCAPSLKSYTAHARCAVLSHALLLLPAGCPGLAGLGLSAQFLCPACSTWKPVRSKHGSRCNACHHAAQRLESLPPLPPSPPPALSPPASLFGRISGCTYQLTTVERAAIVTLHGVGPDRDIAREPHCSENTVSLWLARWQGTPPARRSGSVRLSTTRTARAHGCDSSPPHLLR